MATIPRSTQHYPDVENEEDAYECGESENDITIKEGTTSPGNRRGSKNSFHISLLRTKEKMLQKFGKSGKTYDDFMSMCEEHFSKQQDCAQKLKKELKTYITSVRATAKASQSLHECILSLYEDSWTGKMETVEAVQTLATTWTSHLNELNSTVNAPVEDYILEFFNVKAKILKRRRRCVDFDAARRNYENLRLSKKPDVDKIEKARSFLEETMNMYKSITTELYEELPDLHDKRVVVLSNTFSHLYSSNEQLFEQLLEMTRKLSDAVNSLKAEEKEGKCKILRLPVNFTGPSFEIPDFKTDTIRRHDPSSYTSGTLDDSQIPVSNPIYTDAQLTATNSAEKNSLPSPHLVLRSSSVTPNFYPDEDEDMNYETLPTIKTTKTTKPASDVTTSSNSSVSSKASKDATPAVATDTIPVPRDLLVPPRSLPTTNQEEDDPDDHVYDIVRKCVKPDKARKKGVVQFAHTKRNSEELTVAPGDVIRLLTSDEKLEPGWVYGERESDKARGFVPASYISDDHEG